MIRLRAVTHRYGGRTVLDGVSADLPERRIGLIGANGSGKSTLARTLNGLVVPTEGAVEVDGLDTREQGAAVRRRVGFVFSDPDAQIVMPTVAEDVAFSLRRARLPRAEADRRVAQVLERFGLAGLEDSPAHLLSGGQKQLLALAAVLVLEPSVLVLDEPTTLLDLRNARRITRLVADLPQQVVLVTHHLDLLDDVERVLVLEEGRVVADAPPAAAVAAYRALMA
ncbi:biotin transport system ATP-binding protein [Quadrisphaera sp. DSM 44207]|nr:ABC transporter ATP-binding protein [Quadrisphaera sp. DSM 44207]SDQ48245.1 biotin transport system ATP-binding protein [Quadrisphaera sp. DSM 44207]